MDGADEKTGFAEVAIGKGGAGREAFCPIAKRVRTTAEIVEREAEGEMRVESTLVGIQIHSFFSFISRQSDS